jgi:DNA polymerase (family 10)
MLYEGNEKIVVAFREMAEIMKLLGDDFRSRAYGRAADAVSKMSANAEYFTHDELTQISGIGKSLASKAVEVIRTGTFVALIEAKERADAGYGPTEIERRIMEDAIEPILETISDIRVIKKHLVCGSIRRNAKTVKDADILVCVLKQDVDKAVDKLKVLIGAVGVGDKKKLQAEVKIGKIRRPYKADIVIVDPDCWGAAVLYWTGSMAFNIWLRSQAKSKGYLLDEYGLWKRGKRVIGTDSEKSYFDVLGIKWIDPVARQ